MPTNRTKVITVRAKPQTVAVWRAAAAHRDVTLSQLLRDAADRYSHQLLTSGNDASGIARDLERYAPAAAELAGRL